MGEDTHREACDNSRLKAIGEALFVSSHSSVKLEIADPEWLSRLGFEPKSQGLFLELLFWQLFAVTVGVNGTSLPSAAKKGILEAIEERFFGWLSREVRLDETSVAKIRTKLTERLRNYEQAYDLVADGRQLAATDILLDQLGSVLSSRIRRDNLFTTLPLFSAFTELVLTKSPAVREALNAAP